jgi:hypothetical protein
LPYDKDYKASAGTWYPRQLDMFKGSHDRDVAEKLKASDYPLIVRNDYVLGQCMIDVLKISNRRSSATKREYFDYFMAIIWNQSDDTSIDDIIGTQENKGQLHDKIEPSLKRLIHHIKLNEIEEFKKIAEKERISKIKSFPVKAHSRRICSGDSLSDASVLSESVSDSELESESECKSVVSNKSTKSEKMKFTSHPNEASEASESYESYEASSQVIESECIESRSMHESLHKELIDNLDKLNVKLKSDVKINDFTNPMLLQLHELIKEILK